MLAEPAHAPLERDRDRVRVGRDDLRDLAAEQVLLAVAGELEDAVAGRQHAALLVADDEAGVRPRVVVVHQLEEEAEAAAPAGRSLGREALAGVEVDRALLALRADVVRHAS